MVIPCYNEAANLPLLMARCAEVCAGREEIEFLLVDNGSTDDSPAVLAAGVAEHRGLRSVRVEVNQGYGYGILYGLQQAQGRFMGWTHADMQTDPMDVLVGLAAFENSADPERLFVKGRRFGRPPADVLFTMGMSFFESLLLGKRLWDINAQPTLFPKAFFATWEDPPHDFSLDLYAYHQARVGGLAVERFPVFFGERAHGVSHWNVDWRGKKKFILRTLEFSFRLRRALRHKR
ncbi:putative glycosyl transferase family 2 [Magnetofaba australis IT-1]|uniref:Putative glycosyl transferase family 2 n=1 Tax=Magnetofaba australis IT-1 TaxID=1434232 RepID=A0A1Y2K587_9PROT|nr:putative glycosyl transferase family 2 [Magnetofaba australis IT-1]